MAEQQKPSLTLVGGKLTLESLVALYRHLTGREPTSEEMAEARRALEESRPAAAGSETEEGVRAASVDTDRSVGDDGRSPPTR